MSRIGPRTRLVAAAFLADMALYLIMTGAPYKALALGAGPAILGILPVARALPYTLTTIWAGGRTEGQLRFRGTRLALGLAAIAAVILMFAPGIPVILLLLAVVGLALAFFWPAIQATLADVALAEGMTGNLGWFNIGWSTGKAFGFVIGGLLLAGFGFGALFAASAAALLAVAGIVATFRTRSVPALDPSAMALPIHPRSDAFRRVGWLANAVAFGVGAVLNTHYPQWLETLGRGSSLFGAYLGLVFASQTVTFGCLIRFPGWRYRIAPLLLAQLPLAGVLFLLPELVAPGAILATAPVVGFGLGMCYFASLFYSVDRPAGRGRNAGVHEAVLGVGSMLLPMGGGWIAAGSGRLDAPYIFAAVVVILAVGVQGALLRAGAPSPAGTDRPDAGY